MQAAQMHICSLGILVNNTMKFSFISQKLVQCQASQIHQSVPAAAVKQICFINN
uniref:Uncharacterized protein n=1 Tax=Arundo donax TaxID=35708 RepID=A0A0A9EMR5_ARUDO